MPESRLPCTCASLSIPASVTWKVPQIMSPFWRKVKGSTVAVNIHKYHKGALILGTAPFFSKVLQLLSSQAWPDGGRGGLCRARPLHVRLIRRLGLGFIGFRVLGLRV